MSIMTIVIFVGVCTLPIIIHELGHYIVTILYKKQLKFKILWTQLLKTKIFIPRFVWDMPSGLDENQMITIKVSGFIFEGLFTFLLSIPWIYLYFIVFVLHIVLYTRYPDSEYSDLK